jgi:hypothetical protein
LDKLEIFSPIKTSFREDGSRAIFNSLSFVKDLQFVAPIHKRLGKRCYYGSFKVRWYETDDDLEKANQRLHNNFMENLSDIFRYSFFHLPKNSLQTFAYVVKRPDSFSLLIIVAGD